MFEQVFDNLRTATEANIRWQHEMFKKWTTLWPGMAAAPNGGTEPVQQVQKNWVDFAAEMVKKQRATLETQFSAGLKSIEDGFRLTEAKDADELRTKTVELWQQSFDSIRKIHEAQMREFQAAVVKWTELMTTQAA